MKRWTMADLEQVLGWLADVTGEKYKIYPGGSGMYAVYVQDDSKPRREIASKQLADLIPFLDAYRKGYVDALNAAGARHDDRSSGKPQPN